MGRIYHRTPQKVNTFYHKLNIEELLESINPEHEGTHVSIPFKRESTCEHRPAHRGKRAVK